MAKTTRLCVLLVLVACLVHSCHCEIFTALADLEGTLNMENILAHSLREYIEQEQYRLTEIAKIADDYERHSNYALGDPEKYLSNALNSYLLVKKFTTDWRNVHALLTRNTGEEFIANMQDSLAYLPGDEDLEGAANALLRLQDTYALPTEKIAKGELHGVKESLTLTAGDCFELGRIAYNRGDHYHVVMWMGQALELYNAETNKTVDNLMLVDYLAYSLYMQGNVREALNLTEQWLVADPENQRAANNKKYYIQMLAEQEVDTKGDEGDAAQTHRPFQNKRILDDYRASEEFAAYEALCRGEDTHVIKDARKFTCQYKRHHPIYFYGPLKEETMFLDPWIALYHDVMTDSEVETIKSIAKPRLKRATVQNPQTGKLETAFYRVSKSAWLRDDEHHLIRRVSNKVRAATNLTLWTAEELQVVNYGIGGHYEPHFDFARKRERVTFDDEQGNRIATAIFYKEEKILDEWRGNRVATAIFYPDEVASFDPMAGNRIATAIFYLTDVTAGGLTVFPQVGAKVYPIGKSMAFWYNLKANGEGDYSTRHAGCPVLTGSKWVANKWIHERGQEFARPCGLNPDL